MKFEIGYEFGKMVYVLDALEDFENDLKSGKFNALKTVYGSNILSFGLRIEIVKEVEKYRDCILNLIHELPMNQLIIEGLSARLSQNLELRLNNASSKKSCQINTKIKKVSWREKLQLALEYSKNSLAGKSSSSFVWGKIKFGLSFTLLLITLIVTPYRVWAQNNSRSSDSGCWAIVIIFIVIAICADKSKKPAMVKGRDACGNETIAPGNTCCNCCRNFS